MPTRKKLGYVELEWTCPTCGTRNPGAKETCINCGSPQPEKVKFETPAQAEVLKDEAKIARAKTGPDIHCAYCGARNPATAKVCINCGADLAQGQARQAGGVVSAPSVSSQPEVPCPNCGTPNPASATQCKSCGTVLAKRPQPAPPRPAPEPARGGGMLWVFVSILVVIGLVVGAFLFMTTRRQEVVGVVSDARWVRVIAIEGLIPVEYSAWKDQIPAGVTHGACRPALRYVSQEPVPGGREVCGTPYAIDTGTGIGELVQDCQYEVYDDMCSYSTLEWRQIDQLSVQGSGFDLTWPALSLTASERAGARRETFECEIAANDQRYVYRPLTEEEYALCRPGSRQVVEINGLGAIVSVRPE